MCKKFYSVRVGSAGSDDRMLVHVGRQPIYDRAGRLSAYELLFRDTAGATRASRRSAEATSRVIVAAFTEFGLDALVGARACFINVTREFLVGELPVPFDSNQAVLEIIETVQVDDAVIKGVEELVARDFTIALDDYTPGAHDPLLSLATYVKVVLPDLDPATAAEIVRRCRRDHNIKQAEIPGKKGRCPDHGNREFKIPLFQT